MPCNKTATSLATSISIDSPVSMLRTTIGVEDEEEDDKDGLEEGEEDKLKLLAVLAVLELLAVLALLALKLELRPLGKPNGPAVTLRNASEVALLCKLEDNIRFP